MSQTIEQIKNYIISDLEFHLEKSVVINVDLNLLKKETETQFNYVFVYERDNKLFVEEDFNENAVAEIEYDTELNQLTIRGYTDEFFASNNSKANTDELPFWTILVDAPLVRRFFLRDSWVSYVPFLFFWFRIKLSDSHVLEINNILMYFTTSVLFLQISFFHKLILSSIA